MNTKLQKLLLVIAGIFINTNAFAYDFETDGIYYNITSLEDRTVEVTSDGFDGNYRGHVSIPSKVINNGKTYSVTSIDDYAFSCSHYLTSVFIPNSITNIGECAFDRCDNLTSVNIPKSVTTIGESAFYGCCQMTSIIVHSDNPVYDSRNNCNAIIETATNKLLHGCKNTIIPSSITCIGHSAFRFCNFSRVVTIPTSVTSIEAFAFSSCHNLTSVSNLNSLISIGNHAFDVCYDLTSVIIPQSVTSIEYDAFTRCDNLTSIIVEPENSVYDSRNNCNAIIETATNTLLYGCKNTIIPNSVTIIGNWAFCGCYGLTEITIPNSVTTIGVEAFFNCNNLQTIYCRPTMPPIYDSTFSDNVLMYTTLYVPLGTKSIYESVDPWRNFWNIEEKDFSDVEEIIIEESEYISVCVNSGEIVINNALNCDVTVYSLTGQPIYCNNEYNGESISLSKGIYIVKAGSKTRKVII